MQDHARIGCYSSPVDNILLMRINRPRVKNALNREALRLLAKEGYTTLSQSDRLRCGVVCGEGDVFCAGLDLATTSSRRRLPRVPRLT